MRNKNEVLFLSQKKATWCSAEAGAGEPPHPGLQTLSCLGSNFTDLWRTSWRDSLRGGENKSQVTARVTLRFLSLSRPVSAHACLFTVGSGGWLQLNVNCVMLLDVRKVSVLYMPRQCRTGGRFSPNSRKAKERSSGPGRFLGTAPTKLGENVPPLQFCTFFPLYFHLGISFLSTFLLPGSLRAMSKVLSLLTSV